MQGLYDWLTGLPPLALYLALGAVAAIENVFPPFPADTVVAFGSFLAARGQATLLGVFLGTWIGNVGGAMLTFALGRRFGARVMERRLGGEGATKKFELFYARYGTPSLFLSRFLPAVRAVVPPAAGALRIPPGRCAVLFASASAVWYGTIALVGYKIGDDWERLSAVVKSSARWMGLIAIAIVLVAALVVWLRRRRRGTPA